MHSSYKAIQVSGPPSQYLKFDPVSTLITTTAYVCYLEYFNNNYYKQYACDTNYVDLTQHSINSIEIWFVIVYKEGNTLLLPCQLCSV